MNHDEARKALFEGATVRARFANAKYVFDYKLVDGKIFWQCHNCWDGRLADLKGPWSAWTDSNGDFYSSDTRAATFTKLKPAWPKWYGGGYGSDSGGSVYRQDSSEKNCTAFYSGLASPVTRPQYASFFDSRRISASEAAAWLRANGHTAEADKIDPPKKPRAVSLLKTGQDFQAMTPAELDAAGYGKLPDVPPKPAVSYPRWVKHGSQETFYRFDYAGQKNVGGVSTLAHCAPDGNVRDGCMTGAIDELVSAPGFGHREVPKFVVEEALAKAGYKLVNGRAEKAEPVVEYEPAGTKPEVGDVVVEVGNSGKDGTPSRIVSFDKGPFGGTVAVREDGRRFVLTWFDGPNARNRILKRPAKPAGLYSKFEVTKGGKPLDAGCFVLVPFKADSAINDEAAIKALQTYRAHCDPKLSEDIARWLSNPTSRNGMNRPKGA